MKVAKVANAAAEAMVSSLRIMKRRIPWLFFEGVELAAKQARNFGELLVIPNSIYTQDGEFFGRFWEPYCFSQF